MPHVIVKLWPGRTEEQKHQLADEFTKAINKVLGVPADNVSVGFEEVAPEDWKEKVWNPDIRDKAGTLYKKPNYDPDTLRP
jgi:4-oxalocrotonate tautomerase